MNTVFILGSGILSFAAFSFIQQLMLSKRLQQFASLRMRVIKKGDDKEGNTTTGTFLFQMEATDRRLREVVIAGIHLPGTNLQVHIANQLSFEVQDIYEPLPVRSVGFRCDSDKLVGMRARQRVVEVEGYMRLEKNQRVPFTYKVHMEMRGAKQFEGKEAMA
ncbi:hypothetical protein [Sphingobacterium pedocola]|nr:hypothetical protein [Sphingobacterium pedocola]